MSDNLREPVPRPKTSIFEVTLAGVQEPIHAEKPVVGFWGRLFKRKQATAVESTKQVEGLKASTPDAPPSAGSPTEPRTPGALPRRPKVSIFDVTEHGFAEAAGPESDVTVALAGLEPSPKPAGARPEAAAQAPVSDDARPELSESGVWDEGTAAEWNPRWGQHPGVISGNQELAKADPPARLRFKLLAAVGVTAGVMGLFFTVKMFVGHSGDAQVTSHSIPEELRAYYIKADGGDTAAMRMLGLRYCYGVGAPLNREEGVKWLRKAVVGGNPTAMKELLAMGQNPAQEQVQQ